MRTLPFGNKVAVWVARDMVMRPVAMKVSGGWAISSTLFLG
jgi:hypothetical protein